MNMEEEYKWRANEATLQQALLWASGLSGSEARTVHMQSRYYDSLGGALRWAHMTVRLRQENEQTVCCIKYKNRSERPGLRAHEEYECEAQSVEDGLRALPSHGAPQQLCDLALAQKLTVICTVDFTRVAVLIHEGDAVCELALDKGTLHHDGRTAPLCEIELERKGGDEEAFHRLAATIASQLGLQPEPESKLSRAMAL